MKKKKYKLSAVIACYKDELAIPIMYQRLRKVFKLLGCDYQIIFVNDASPDNTKEILRKLVQSDKKVVAIHHTRNFGSQMAFMSGARQASGDGIVFFDGDLQDPPELIPKLVRNWQKGYQVVYGVRTSRDSPFFSRVMYKLFYRIFHLVSYVRIPVDAGDFSLIDKRVLKVLLSFPERDVFFRGLRAWVGFSQKGVPYRRPERFFGSSTNNIFKNFSWATKGIFSFSFVPLKLITYASLATFALSVIGIFLQVLIRLLVPGTPRGVTTIIVIVLFLGSVQLLSIGILGEYIAKIFEETKRRPHFIIESIETKSNISSG